MLYSVPVKLPEDILLTETQQTLLDEFQLQTIAVEPDSGLYLNFIEQQLRLCQVGSKANIVVDFVSGSAQHRRLQGGGELIAKAVNVKKNKYVWDFTAGLGRDAFVLASFGLDIVLFERHPIVSALLADGLNRAHANEQTQKVAQCMRLIFADVLTQTELLQKMPRPQVIYLDPMYPESNKSAAVKKEMAFFHELVGYHEDGRNLLPLALSLASQRVVVKRPRLAPTLTERKPDYAYTGKSTRFDVYVPDHPHAHEDGI